VALTGTGTGAGGSAIDVSVPSLDFGPISVGATRDLSFVIHNGGSTPLAVTALTTSNPQFFAFTLQSPFGGTATSFTVPAGGQQTVYVRFQPSGAGAVSATLTVVSNDPVKGSLPLALTGTGVGP
jgi:hypothetical protein